MAEKLAWWKSNQTVKQGSRDEDSQALIEKQNTLHCWRRNSRTMAENQQPGWTRLRTATGRYEYQFQGEMPSVRAGKYEDARDYQFLVLDDDGWLHKIPVRLDSHAAAACMTHTSRLQQAHQEHLLKL